MGICRRRCRRWFLLETTLPWQATIVWQYIIQIHRQHISGHAGSIPYANQCWSITWIKIRIQKLTPIWINKDHCWSILINKDQFCSIKINKDQCRLMPISACSEAIASDPVLICNDLQWYAMICNDLHWSALSFIELYWVKLIFIDRNWSIMICIEPYFRSIPEIWSLLIGIDQHLGLNQHVLIYILLLSWDVSQSVSLFTHFFPAKKSRTSSSYVISRARKKVRENSFRLCLSFWREILCCSKRPLNHWKTLIFFNSFRNITNYILLLPEVGVWKLCLGGYRI